MLGLESSIKPQNSMKVVKVIFVKTEILNFFLSELHLILWVRSNEKQPRDIFARGPYISNFNEIGQLVRSYVRR